jgi:uncharacterized protein
MRPYLLDVNLLIALAWPSHIHHQLSQRWFARKKRAGFRTCPLTQTGFVRICSNPAFSKDAVSPLEALSLLSQITELPGHAFWPDNLTLLKALDGFKNISGHRQITDAYLLALAHDHGGALATLDRALLLLAPERSRVEIPSDIDPS